MTAAPRRSSPGRGRGPLLSRRLFVRRAVGTTAGAWLAAQLAACGDDAVDAHAGGDASGVHDADLDADAATVETGSDGGPDAGGMRDASGSLDAAEPDGAPTDAAAPDADACEPFLTPLATFFMQHGAQGTVTDWREPDLDVAAHRLVVDGEVATPLALSLSELAAMPQLTVVNTMQCVFRLQGTALYSGVPVRALLDAAGIDRGATRRIRMYGADGFRNNLLLEDVYPADGAAAGQRFEPLLALSIGGEPLPRGHGLPARLVLCDRWGYKNVKWIARIEATQSDEPVGDYQELGLASDAAIIAPNTGYRGEHRLRAGPAGAVTLCGHAVSGADGIASVEVSVDAGELVAARIVPLSEVLAAEPRLRDALQVQEGWDYPFVGVKAPWELDLELGPGEHTLTLRVTDRAGRVGDNFRARLMLGA